MKRNLHFSAIFWFFLWRFSTRRIAIFRETRLSSLRETPARDSQTSRPGYTVVHLLTARSICSRYRHLVNDAVARAFVCSQHRAVRRRHLRARGRPRPDPEVREPGRADSARGHHVHTPQPQLADAGQRHRAAQAARTGRAQGRRVPGVPAGPGRQPRGGQTVHRHRVRVHGRGGPDTVAHPRGRDPGGQRRRVHTQDKRGHREDIHTAGQQLLRGRRGGKRRLSGIRLGFFYYFFFFYIFSHVFPS